MKNSIRVVILSGLLGITFFGKSADHSELLENLRTEASAKISQHHNFIRYCAATGDDTIGEKWANSIIETVKRKNVTAEECRAFVKETTESFLRVLKEDAPHSLGSDDVFEDNPLTKEARAEALKRDFFWLVQKRSEKKYSNGIDRINLEAYKQKIFFIEEEDRKIDALPASAGHIDMNDDFSTEIDDENELGEAKRKKN